MSDIPEKHEKIRLLMNSGIPDNKLSYVLEKASSEDQVVSCISLRKSCLIEWSSWIDENHDMVLVDLLNDLIPKGSFKVKPTSSRMNERLRIECYRAKQKLKILNRKGAKSKRIDFLDRWTKVTILSSDIMIATEYESEIKKME